MSPEELYNQGVLLQSKGRRDEAMASYRAALEADPRMGPARNNLGNLLRASGRLDEAIEQYSLAVRDSPAMPEPLANWGALLREAGRLEEAVPLLERALEIKPASPSALHDLGLARLARYRIEEAVECFRRALELRPAFDAAQANLGAALGALGRWEEALPHHAAVAARQPANARAQGSVGRAHQGRGDLDAAQASYERSLALDPADAETLCDLGLLAQERGRLAESMDYFARALQADPRIARAAHALAVAHLKRFEFERGWQLAEARFDTMPPVTPRRELALPYFSAESWGRGRIAIWREQGVGDQLLLCTLLPEVAARGQDFVAEVDRRLLPAFARAHPSWRMAAIEDSGAAFAQCDSQLPIGSLPRLLRPTVASFESQPRALLAADPARATAFRAALGTGRRWIGISWRSFQPQRRGRIEARKSAGLAPFQRLSRQAGLGLVDLQYGDTEAERTQFARDGGMLRRIDGLDLFDDLDGVMAAIEACDAVITTSNVTAHLAGAIGKRTLLIYPAGWAPFHYWVPGPGGRSLWYPSVEIVTAPDLDGWDALVARAAALLAP